MNRVKNQTNRRSIEISLTQKGIDLIKGAQATAAQRILQRLSELSDEDAKTLVDCLEKIGEILI